MADKTLLASRLRHKHSMEVLTMAMLFLLVIAGAPSWSQRATA